MVKKGNFGLNASLLDLFSTKIVVKLPFFIKIFKKSLEKIGHTL